MCDVQCVIKWGVFVHEAGGRQHPSCRFGHRMWSIYGPIEIAKAALLIHIEHGYVGIHKHIIELHLSRLLPTPSRVQAPSAKG